MTTLDDRVRQGFITAGMPAVLADEALNAFAEAKQRFYRHDLRPSEIEGARFAESVFRILQWETTGAFTPLGKTLPSVDKMLADLQNASGNESVRLHIPRTLRLIYDVRNKRDVAHLGDGIDPNEQDATLVIRNMEWVLAELVRLHHGVSPTEAHGIIVDLISKDFPVIQVFDGIPRILKQMRASDHVLVLLYWSGQAGATFDQLCAWARPPMRANLRRTLTALDAKDLLHYGGDRYVLTHLGERYVESHELLDPI